MKKKLLSLMLLITVLCAAMSFTACTVENPKDAAYKLYYVNPAGTGLTMAAYNGQTTDTERAVEEILQELTKSDDEISRQPAIPDKVKVEKIVLEDEKLSIYFNEEYNKMDVVKEVLCRAAVVRSLTQLEGVSMIAFYVGEEPLTDSNGVEYGYIQADDFVQNTGSSINSYEKKKVILYLPTEDGNKLVRKEENIRFNSNKSFEQVIVARLMRGVDGKNMVPLIPKETKILGVSVKDGICYLNFDEGIKKPTPGVGAEAMVYSIVNTLTEGGNVTRVQILVNGEKDVVLQEKVKLSDPLSYNIDIVEEQ